MFFVIRWIAGFFWQRLVNQNKFPAPVNLGKRSIGWLENDIISWIEKIKEQRDDAVPFKKIRNMQLKGKYYE